MIPIVIRSIMNCKDLVLIRKKLDSCSDVASELFKYDSGQYQYHSVVILEAEGWEKR